MGRKKEDFTNLVNQYSGMLYRYAYWLSSSPAVAQDLLQETFLRAWKGYDKLQKPESAKHWLITILRRENARRFERKQFRTVERDVDTFEGKSSFENFDNRAEAFALRYALERISKEYREPLILQVLCGYTCKEIGEMLELTPEAVMTRLYRARKQLREILVKEGDHGPRSKKP